jgi:hypothetical protein
MTHLRTNITVGPERVNCNKECCQKQQQEILQHALLRKIVSKGYKGMKNDTGYFGSNEKGSH